ncbi:MAG: hypothetical protein V4594_14515 [Bacteroidota bacterium]
MWYSHDRCRPARLGDVLKSAKGDAKDAHAAQTITHQQQIGKCPLSIPGEKTIGHASYTYSNHD